ncbi:flavin reductase family protein [Lacticaseibacillus kribbianus]|uniref:flavin reductase family protein n=1 Tax=Lacticaseibacillus kribbianus TaxID=2926292 RepID=UPI001CD3DE47|nr:flavin reductase family protein [Lacticaseibacillus kribbianus]
MIDYTTSKLYFAYPIFVIGYEDEQFGVNVTTASSSYSLGDLFAFGISAATNAAAQLKRTRRCTINFLTAADLPGIERAGFLHAEAKLPDSRLPYQLDDGLPVLTRAFAVLKLTIDDCRESHGVANFTATIDQRLVDRSTLLPTGKLDPLAIDPPLFAGDDRQRVYRTLGPDSVKLGTYLRD